MELIKLLLEGMPTKERIIRSLSQWQSILKRMYPHNIKLVGTTAKCYAMLGDDIIGKWNGYHGVIYDSSRPMPMPSEEEPVVNYQQTDPEEWAWGEGVTFLQSLLIELSPDTLKSYTKKAKDDIEVKKHNKEQTAAGHVHSKDPLAIKKYMTKTDKKIEKRESGIVKAAAKS